MPIAKEYIKERSPITVLTRLNDKSIAYSTQYSGARLINNENIDTKLKIIHKELSSQTTATCFSPDEKFLAFANSNIINILDINTKKIIKVIKTLLEEITILIFSADSNYIIAGSHTGRVYQYKYNSSALLARLCSFSHKQKKQSRNYVSAFAIFNNKLACSGSAGALYIIDLLQTKKETLIKQGERVDALCFIDEETLISGDRMGTILIHSLNSTCKAKTIDAPFTNIKQIIKMPNPNYIMISSDTNYVAIADIKNSKIAHSKYAIFETTVSHIVSVSQESIFVALDNNKIINLSLESPSGLKSLIIHNSLYEAYRLVDSEPMLRECIEYKLLEKRYESIYKDTLTALMNQNNTLAKSIIEVFKGVRSKEQEISSLFIAFEKYNRFKVLYLEKKYALAYATCNKHEALKLTPLYLKLEERFKESFINAQRHMKMGKDKHAIDLMNEYITVASKRDIIKLFLNRDKKFHTFLKAIDEKDFQTIEELKYDNKLFIQAPTYVSLNQTIEKNIKEIDLCIEQNNLAKAKELLVKFKNTSHVNKDLKRLHENLNNMQNLQDAYQKNDFKSCYEILDSHHPLNSTQLGILLNKHWAKLINECEEHALNGNAKGIKTSLDTLISISTRRNKIGDLLRVSFHSKIKASLANKRFNNAENIIYSYIDIFGSDNEIKSLMNAYEVISKKSLAITQEQDERGKRDKWMDSDLIIESDS